MPTGRGFDSFLGILHSGADHYTYETESPFAYDLWNNLEPELTRNGTYSSANKPTNFNSAEIVRTSDFCQSKMASLASGIKLSGNTMSIW